MLINAALLDLHWANFNLTVLSVVFTKFYFIALGNLLKEVELSYASEENKDNPLQGIPFYTTTKDKAIEAETITLKKVKFHVATSLLSEFLLHDQISTTL